MTQSVQNHKVDEPRRNVVQLFNRDSETIFNSAFNDKTIYRRNDTLGNIRRLIGALHDNRVDLSNTLVASIAGPGGTPGKDQRCIFSEWYRHFFVIHNGCVLDLDFGSEPQMLSVLSYLEHQFIPARPAARETVLDRWVVSTVPVTNFCRAFDLLNKIEALTEFLQKEDDEQHTQSLRCFADLYDKNKACNRCP